MAKKKFIFLLIIILFSIPITITSEERTSNPDLLHLNYEASLPYGSYIYFHQIADENYEIKWEFSGSNSYVGIKVYAMTDLEFDKFQNLQTFYSYQLSDGSYIRDSGTFTPRSHDDWYVVFLNADSDMQTTYLTYDVDFVQDTSSLLIIVGILIACLAVGGIIGAYIFIHNNKKRKLLIQEASQTIVPSSNQEQKEPIKNYNQNIQFCTSCGSPRRSENAYCGNCGKKF